MILTAEELFSGKNNAEYYFFELSALNIALIPPVIPENPFTIAKILKTGPIGINRKSKADFLSAYIRYTFYNHLNLNKIH